jgi:membrane-associated phospholipid phosphatase
MPEKTSGNAVSLSSEERVGVRFSKKNSSSNFFAKNLKFIYTSAFFLFIFYAFSFLLVKGGRLKAFDFNMTVRIQDRVPLRLDPYLSVLSLLGSFEPTFAILCIFLFFTRKKMKSLFVVFLFCFMHIVELVGKAFLDHPPTPFMFHRYALNILFPTSYVQPGGSYPSGHAMRITFLAIVFGFVAYKTKNLSRELKIFTYLIIVTIYLIMCISRISLGEHWTSDVIGGSILGVAFAALSLIFI